jgi:branched-chain amino acid transport system ATP-binding protein
LDEPSLGLAPVLVEEIFSIIEQINHEGTTILLVEQNANMALEICHYGYVLETGTISIEDKNENLLANEEVTRSYLGK